MGVLSDYFVASETELGAVGTDGELPASLPRIDLKGFGFIPAEALAEHLGVEAFVPGEPPVHGADYEWVVMQLTSPFVSALGKLSDEDITKLAPVVGAIEELDWPAQDTARVLRLLRDLAAKAGDRNVYLWMCT